MTRTNPEVLAGVAVWDMRSPIVELSSPKPVWTGAVQPTFVAVRETSGRRLARVGYGVLDQIVTFSPGGHRMKPHRPLAAVLLTTLLLAGCGDKEKDPSSEPTDTNSSTPSPTPSGPAAAEGDEVDHPLFTYRLPEGWANERLTDDDDMTLDFGRSPEQFRSSNLIVEVFDSDNFTDVTKLSPDVLRNWEQDSNGGKALPPTDWAGQRAYHFSSDDCAIGHCEQIGLNYKSHWVVLTIDFVTAASQYAGKKPEFEFSPEQIQETIDSIEASWEWK